MSTRSAIGIENSDGTITGIYCHWDGYPSHNGRILFEHYKTERRVRRLMNLGDLSSLGKYIGRKHEFNNPYPFMDPQYNQWETKFKGHCTAYKRDRNEDGTEASEYRSVQHFVNALHRAGCEYYYVFRNGEWYFTTDCNNANLALLFGTGGSEE